MKKLFVDFDGTISPIHYPNSLTEPPHSDCVKTLLKFKEQGFQIVIHSCRANPDLGLPRPKEAVAEMIDYLKKHNIPYDSIDTTKQLYSLLIDDRAGFDGDWSKILGAMNGT